MGSRACKAPRRREKRSGGNTREEAQRTTNHGPEPMDIVEDVPEPEPASLQPSRPDRPITEKEQMLALPPPSQPSELVIEREQLAASPQPSQPDWPVKGERWRPAPQEQRRMKCRALDIQTVHLEVRCPSGASLSAPPPPGKVPVVAGFQEIDCDKDLLDGDPMEADIGVPA